MTENDVDALLTPADVRRLLGGISPMTLRRLVLSGKLEAPVSVTGPGGRPRWRASTIAEFIKRCGPRTKGDQ